MQIPESSILVVDDELFLRELLHEWLKRRAGQVFTAADGAEAMQVLAANRIDVVVTDIRMPVMDGIELLREVQSQAKAAPGVIFVTGYSDFAPREAYDLGVAAILEKPVDRHQLLHAIEKCLAAQGELWSMPAVSAPETTLRISFESLSGALQEERIAFGREGLAIESDQPLHEGPINIELDFKADDYVLAAQGIVRWTAPQENQIGIELTYVAEDARAKVLQLVKDNHSISLIPRTARHTPAMPGPLPLRNL